MCLPLVDPSLFLTVHHHYYQIHYLIKFSQSLQVLHNEVCLTFAEITFQTTGCGLWSKSPDFLPLCQHVHSVLETYSAFTRKSYRFIDYETLKQRLHYNMDTMSLDHPPIAWLDRVFSKYTSLRGTATSGAAAKAASIRGPSEAPLEQQQDTSNPESVFASYCIGIRRRMNALDREEKELDMCLLALRDLSAPTSASANSSSSLLAVAEVVDVEYGFRVDHEAGNSMACPPSRVEANGCLQTSGALKAQSSQLQLSGPHQVPPEGALLGFDCKGSEGLPVAGSHGGSSRTEAEILDRLQEIREKR